jgi:hypothetical protein
MKNEAGNYEVIFGSNRILNCGRVVEVVGRGVDKQFIRFREGEDRKILFECTVTDEKGDTEAKVANSRVQHIVDPHPFSRPFCQQIFEQASPFLIVSRS